MRRLLVTAVLALTGALSALAMSYAEARQEALFLTDKMAYELGLNEEQYDAVYEINLDYLMAVTSSRDVKGTYLLRRNYDINCVLTAVQYSKFYKADYFYTPATWDGGVVLKVYTRYADRSKMYYPAPRVYGHYRGGHSWTSNGNKSWYKGRNFRDGAEIGHGRPAAPSHGGTSGHGVRRGHSHTSGGGAGHGIRPSHQQPKPARPGVGHGAAPKPNKPNTHKPDTHKPGTGVGHGVTVGGGIGQGAQPETQKPDTGVGHGVTVGGGVFKGKR